MNLRYANAHFRAVREKEIAAKAHATGYDGTDDSLIMITLTTDGGKTFVSPLSDTEKMFTGADTLVRHDAIYEPQKFNTRILCAFVSADCFEGGADRSLPYLSAAALVKVLNVFGTNGWRLVEKAGKLIFEKEAA